MSENMFNEGDEIEIVKDMEKVSGVVQFDHRGTSIPFITVYLAKFYLRDMMKQGYTVNVTKKAPMMEPKRNYTAVKFDGKIPVLRHEDGKWYYVGYPGYMAVGSYQDGKTWEALLADNDGETPEILWDGSAADQ